MMWRNYSMKYVIGVLLVLFTISCMKEDPELLKNNTPEGLPAQLMVTIDPPQMTKAGLNPQQEKAVTNAQVLVFNSSGQVVTNQFFSSVSAGSGIQSVKTSSGSNMSVYIVANISTENSNNTSLFGNVRTLSDLNAVKVYNLGTDITNNKKLMMWGVVTGVTIPPAPQVATIPVNLNYVASKIRIHLIDDTPVNEDISWTDWQVQDPSRFSYLIPQASDAVNPANAGDFVSATAQFAWRDTVFTVGGVQKPGKYTIFYLYENRRGGRVANNATPPAGYNPRPIDSTDPRDKAWYAPARATALIANGFYSKQSGNTGVKATIYLGSNNYNDYNVARKNEYTFTVTVKGLNQIDIDSRVEPVNIGFQASVLATTLDAHYDWRPLQLGAFAGSTLTVDILDGSTGLPPASPSTFWLKVSGKNLNQFVLSGSTYVRPTYNPATEMLTSISGITFTNASQITYKNYYLYADEFMTEGGSRTALVKISSSAPGSVPVVIPITQKGYQTMGTVGLRRFDLLGTLLSGSYQLAVENQEEATMTLTPGSSAEATNTMQWGFNGIDMQGLLPSVVFDYYKRNGDEATYNLVVSNSATGALRTPYGRTGTATISEQIHNPIFNTYAARYCFEKNRDLNGDGVINGAEVKWYLPSLDELMLLYIGEPSLSQVAGEKISANSYQSSTESSLTTTDNLGLNFSQGMSGISPKPSALYVRCVRKL